MIGTEQRQNDVKLATLIRSSIGGFMQEHGGQLVEQDAPVPEGKVGVVFDSTGLDRPMMGVFDSTVEPLRVASTLIVSEPGLIDVRLKAPAVGASPLDFLTRSSASGSARKMTSEELLQLTPPNRPIDELRDYLGNLATDFRNFGVPFARDIHTRVADVVASLVQYTVARYYPQIDRATPGDLQEVCDLFAQDGAYDRAGKVLRGRPAIESFYTTERTLSGVHTVESIAVSGLTALVTGEFKGVSLREGAPRLLEFADRWRFSTEGFVTHRHTYLSQGHSNAQ